MAIFIDCFILSRHFVFRFVGWSVVIVQVALIPFALASAGPVFIVTYPVARETLDVVVKLAELEALVAAYFSSFAFRACEKLYVGWFW